LSLIATCHCGATKIELPHPPAVAKECNCTFCARSGAIWGYYPPSQFKLLSQDGDKVYAPGAFNRHHFCGNCGMQTWGDSPDWAAMYNPDGTPKNGDANALPTERVYAVNLRLIDDFDWSSVTVEKSDGRNSW
jgi:hypothetical protein